MVRDALDKLVWGGSMRVDIRLMTHQESGITRLDFELAGEIERIAKSSRLNLFN